MKKLLLALALAGIVATPAFAQSQRSRAHAVRAPETWTIVPEDVYAQSPRGAWRNDVYNLNGEYLGTDPDPFIRQQLLRDGFSKDSED